MSEKLPRIAKKDLGHLKDVIWKNREKVRPLIRNIRAIFADASIEKPHSFSNDLQELNNLFGTEIQVKGVENIPQSGGVVLVTSHIVSIDKLPGWINKEVNPAWWLHGIARGVAQVRSDEIRPVTYALGGAGGQYSKIIKALYGGFPVFHKEKLRDANRVSLQAARQAIDEGNVVLIAPEGENRVALTKAKYGGMSKLIDAGVPFVPVTYYEEEDGVGEFSYTVEFGKPVVCDFSIEQPASDADRERVVNFTENIMTKIALLLPEEKQGYYATLVEQES